MADKFQLKAILSAVDKITPTTTQIGKSVKILHKSLRDIGNAGGELMRKIGVPAFLSFSAVTFGAIRATQAAIDFAGSVQDASDRTGAGLEEYQALSNMLIMTGGSAEDAEMAITKFNKGVSEGAAGADKNFAGLLKRLGVPLKNSKGNLVSMADALPQLAAGFAKNKDPAIQTRMAMELWGKSGTKLIPLMNSLADGSISLEAAMKEVVSAQSIQSLDNMGDAMDGLRIKVRNTVNNALAKLVPVFQPIIDSMGEWITQNQEFLQTQIVGAITDITNALKQVNWVEVFKGIKETIKDIKGFVDAIGGVKTLIYGLGLAWAAGPIAALMSIMGAVWRLRLAFTALSISAAASGTAVAGSFGTAATASMVSNLSVLARSAGLLGAAALVGYGIGTAINSALSESTKDKIGEIVARALAFFGNDEAKRALNANGIGLPDGTSKQDSYKNPQGIFKSNQQYAELARQRTNIVGNQNKLNGEMTVKFENAPPGMRVESAKSNQSGFDFNADVGMRRIAMGY